MNFEPHTEADLVDKLLTLCNSPKDKELLSWFEELVELSETKFGGIINKEDRESYREYFDDGDTPIEVIDTEISYMVPDIG